MAAKGKNQSLSIIYKAATCIGVTFLIFMGFARVYLGAHAINQVIFGVLFAVSFALVGHYKVKPLFLDLPEYLSSDMEGSGYRVTVMSYVKSMLFGLVLPMILASLVLIMKDDMEYYYICLVYSIWHSITQTHGITETRTQGVRLTSSRSPT